MKKRLVFLPVFTAALSFSAFLRSNGSNQVKTVQILTLIGVGMCLGVALSNLLVNFSAKSKD
jgi:uncharacterized membrane protein YwzB